MTHAPDARRVPRARFANWPTLGRETLFAAITALISTAAGAAALRITPTVLGQRWQAGGDDMVLHYDIFSSGVKVFPYLPNHQLGFPHAQNLFFAPLFDVWSAIYVRLAGLFGADGVLALNLYNVLAFFACGATAYLFFRALRLRPVTAIVFGVLLGASPYHFYQLLIGHPFIANYWAVPLIGILALIIAGPGTDPTAAWVAGASTARGRHVRRLVPIVLITLAVALTQSYFYVFALIVLGGIWLFVSIGTVIRTRAVRTLLWPTASIVLLIAFVGAQLLVLSLNFGDRYGNYFADRTPEESEIFGGSTTSLLLPWPLSGIPPFAKLPTYYANITSLLKVTEQPATAAIASLGMVLLVAALIIRALTIAGSAQTRFTRILDDRRVGVLTGGFLWAYLFFIATGLGFVFAELASPEIRAWSRMSIILAMFAFAFVALLVDTLVRRRGWRYLVLVVIAVVGIADQFIGVYRAAPLNPTSDDPLRAYSAAVTRTVPSDCGIVQLPLKGFPETGPIGRMGDYDEGLLFAYAPRSGSVRWSYGAVQQTDDAAPWNKVTDPASFAAAVRNSNACAVQIDTFAYQDSASWSPFVDALTDSSAPTLKSSDGRFLLFALEQ
jgi:hypothetical protein